MTVIEKVGNPAQALSAGAEKLKEAVGEFFVKIKTKVKEISGSIKEKVTLLGQPAQLIKTIANKAVDMVLNFIITHPPSALIKAVFKGIEAIAGKSIVELIRQYIPYADKILDKIAGSGPVQGIMKPLEGPVKTVGGMIDQVTDQTTGMVDSAEKTTLSSMGSGAKLMTAMGIGGQSKNESKAGGKETGQAQGGSKAEGGGDIFGTVRSGIHNNLMTLGLINLKKLGMQILAAGAAKISGAIRKMLTPKVKFKLGNETHELWVEKGQNRNVVMMASDEKTLEDQIQAGKVKKSVELTNSINEAENPENEKIVNSKLKNVTLKMQSPTEADDVKNTLILYGKGVETVPGNRKGDFNKWFNSLTSNEFDELWKNPSIRETIEDRLRKPGKLHEWHLVSRTPVFKRWGVTADQIKDMRTLTKDTKFVNPIGIHGGDGSTTAHNELLDIIDSSKDYDMFKRRLQNWANYRLERGAAALPGDLKRI